MFLGSIKFEHRMRGSAGNAAERCGNGSRHKDGQCFREGRANEANSRHHSEFPSHQLRRKLPPQSAKVKFTTAAQDSFDYSSIFIPLALAGYSQRTNSTPEFGTGATAYGRYLWHAAVDQTQENFMVEFIVPALTHEDTRYYTLGRGVFGRDPVMR